MAVIWHIICQINDISNLIWKMITTFECNHGERGAGRKARGLQTKKNRPKVSFFLSLLSDRKKETSGAFFPSLYRFKKKFLLKLCVAIVTPGSTLNLTSSHTLS